MTGTICDHPLQQTSDLKAEGYNYLESARISSRCDACDDCEINRTSST